MTNNQHSRISDKPQSTPDVDHFSRASRSMPSSRKRRRGSRSALETSPGFDAALNTPLICRAMCVAVRQLTPEWLTASQTPRCGMQDIKSYIEKSPKGEISTSVCKKALNYGAVAERRRTDLLHLTCSATSDGDDLHLSSTIFLFCCSADESNGDALVISRE